MKNSTIHRRGSGASINSARHFNNVIRHFFIGSSASSIRFAFHFAAPLPRSVSKEASKQIAGPIKIERWRRNKMAPPIKFIHSKRGCQMRSQTARSECDIVDAARCRATEEARRSAAGRRETLNNPRANGEHARRACIRIPEPTKNRTEIQMRLNYACVLKTCVHEILFSFAPLSPFPSFARSAMHFCLRRTAIINKNKRNSTKREKLNL